MGEGERASEIEKEGRVLFWPGLLFVDLLEILCSEGDTVSCIDHYTLAICYFPYFSILYNFHFGPGCLHRIKAQRTIIVSSEGLFRPRIASTCIACSNKNSPIKASKGSKT